MSRNITSIKVFLEKSEGKVMEYRRKKSTDVEIELKDSIFEAFKPSEQKYHVCDSAVMFTCY